MAASVVAVDTEKYAGRTRLTSFSPISRELLARDRACAVTQVRFGRCSGKLSPCGGHSSISSICRLTVPDTVSRLSHPWRWRGPQEISAQSKSPRCCRRHFRFSPLLRPVLGLSPTVLAHPVARVREHTDMDMRSPRSAVGPATAAPQAGSMHTRMAQDSDSGSPIWRASWPPNGQPRCTLPSESAPSQMRLACTLNH